jgi:hypothetical protein
MPISSSCIFHYTNNPTTLYRILQEQMFLPSYCKEKSGLDRSTFVRVPMVSFCDVPLTQTAKITSYGNFAIGMKMEWAVKNRLNPLFYLPANSLVFERNKKLVEEFVKFEKVKTAKNSIDSFNSYAKLFLMLSSKDIMRLYSNDFKIPQSLVEPIQNIYLSFFQNIKETVGTLHRRGKSIENYKFYDEREWRYIPPVLSTKYGIFPPYIDEVDWIKSERNKFGEKPHFGTAYGLGFSPSDIDYIIVDTEKRILSLISKLKKMYPKNYEVLLTKISSFERIKKDF